MNTIGSRALGRDALHLFLPLAGAVAGVTAVVTLTNVLLPLAVQTYLFYLILVLGLQLFAGNSGILSFGHVGFTAIGAYTAAILTIPVEQKGMRLHEMPEYLVSLHADPVVAVLVGSAVATAIAVVIGIPIMRLVGLSAAIATFSFLIIIHVVATNLAPLTNGRSGLTGIPVAAGTWTVLAWCLVALAVAVVFMRTTLALRLRAAREDDIAARAAGLGILRERLTAWVLSAAVFGAGGAVYALFITTFSPDAFYLSLTFTVVAMLVVGGVGSVTGAVVGAIFLATSNEVLRVIQGGPRIGPVTLPDIPGLQAFGVALITLLVLMFRPSGLTRGRELGAILEAARASYRGSRSRPRADDVSS